ncbi:hypothetical protein BHE74_00026102 [Ensete ventricosum]|uniref:Uncharacterized protein n=1 Tax=Ensete ventricosum TaxID=4639 RepID=A0A427AZY7_ENSVE|nr:hypothetical protein B296_00019230 [Ensete ventricosum]RWW34880.1 hypothetical protein GW17_00000339 [Ensete ventricosum]RWW66509.1 hypothetical protein BHE74_00026102 [Ensete ventricosum]RZR79928.1 hypothetical protein BHM03_00005806 [Ensete ventricosum]
MLFLLRSGTRDTRMHARWSPSAIPTNDEGRTKHEPAPNPSPLELLNRILTHDEVGKGGSISIHALISSGPLLCIHPSKEPRGLVRCGKGESGISENRGEARTDSRHPVVSVR